MLGPAPLKPSNGQLLVRCTLRQSKKARNQSRVVRIWGVQMHLAGEGALAGILCQPVFRVCGQRLRACRSCACRLQAPCPAALMGATLPARSASASLSLADAARCIQPHSNEIPPSRLTGADTRKPSKTNGARYLSSLLEGRSELALGTGGGSHPATNSSSSNIGGMRTASWPSSMRTSCAV